MALDDYLEPEVGIAVAVTAAVAVRPVRRALRWGAVYSLAGLLIAGDKLADLARGVRRKAQEVAGSTGTETQQAAAQPRVIVPGQTNQPGPAPATSGAPS